MILSQDGRSVKVSDCGLSRRQFLFCVSLGDHDGEALASPHLI